MSWQKTRERIRRIEFNLTEPEVLTKLIERSKAVGEDIRRTNANTGSTARGIAKKLGDQAWIHTMKPSLGIVDSLRIFGVDGSSYPVEGLSSVYHVPTTAAAVEFVSGLNSQIRVTIDADIFDYQVGDQGQLSRENTLTMLAMETKLLLRVSRTLVDKEHSIVMLDGPIVDPPWPAPDEYIQNRCAALKQCLRQGACVIGVVKSPRESFFCEYLSDTGLSGISGLGQLFRNDFYLMAQVLNQYRKATGARDALRTSSIPLSDSSPASSQYSSRSILVSSFFYQHDRTSRPLRIDWCHEPEGPVQTDSACENVARLVQATTYPGIPYPLPVFLAHRKCTVRQGCAEVLFEDIMTRARVTSEEDAILIEIVRGGRW